MCFIFILSVFEVAPLLVWYILFVTCKYVSLNWGSQWDQKVLNLCNYILSFLCKYVSQSWSTSGTRTFDKIPELLPYAIVPLYWGGFVVIG